MAGPGHPARCARSTRCTADGAEVTVIGPGAEDLEAIGGNLMDVGRRPHVLETSLRTSAAPCATPRH